MKKAISLIVLTIAYFIGAQFVFGESWAIWYIIGGAIIISVIATYFTMKWIFSLDFGDLIQDDPNDITHNLLEEIRDELRKK